MQYGFILPHGDVHTLAELAHEAEIAGWDGVFYWDGIYIKEAGPMYDPWIVLAAMDHLSHRRLILPVGLGALDDGALRRW